MHFSLNQILYKSKAIKSIAQCHITIDMRSRALQKDIKHQLLIKQVRETKTSGKDKKCMQWVGYTWGTAWLKLKADCRLNMKNACQVSSTFQNYRKITLHPNFSRLANQFNNLTQFCFCEKMLEEEDFFLLFKLETGLFLIAL